VRKTLWRNLIIIMAIFLVFFSVTYCKNYASSPASFTVVYSNDVIGEVEPCG
jgi:hypothetical protein